MSALKVEILEPFYTGSHAQWADSLAQFSSHKLSVNHLPGKHWKWRMYGAAVTFASHYRSLEELPDLFLATDMLDLAAFRGLSDPEVSSIPTALYFHESQFDYPGRKDNASTQERDHHFAFINYTSALAADKIFFNSAYHQQSFLEALSGFLKMLPDRRNLETVDQIRARSSILYYGLDLSSCTRIPRTQKDPDHPAVLLWNHRWEHDKNPEAFFRALKKLKDAEVPFRLILLGERYARIPAVFDQARKEFREEIIYDAYALNRAEYLKVLTEADILPVTSLHDFFGVSVVEAMACNCYPLLPDRLAYPEHIPESIRVAHLYKSEEEFADKLAVLCMDIKRVRAMSFYSWVEKYDWSNLIKVYDEVFSALYEKTDPVIREV